MDKDFFFSKNVWPLFCACIIGLMVSCNNEAPATETNVDTSTSMPTTPAANNSETPAAQADSGSRSLDVDNKDVNEARESLKKALDEL